MFARHLRNSQVCLRCLRQQSLTKETEPDAIVARVGRQHRGQSGVAAAAREDVDDDDQVSIIRKSSTETSKHKWKKWRPPNTEILGVPSLGRPAEVLVLPARDRKIPTIPAGSDSKKHEIQASLDSELHPLTQEQVNDNLDLLRPPPATATGVADGESLGRLRKTLVKGFKTNQLLRYIEYKQQRPFKLKDLSRTKTGFKVRLANYIVSQLWLAASPADQNDRDQSIKSSKFTFSHPVLQAILAQSNKPLQALSEEENLRIDVLGEDLIFTPLKTATADVASQANQQVLKKLKLLQATIIKKRQRLGKRPSDGEASSPPTAEELVDLGGRHEAYIEQGPQDSHDMHFHRDNKHVVDRIQRQLFWAPHNGPASCRYFRWPQVSKNIPSILVDSDGRLAASATDSSDRRRLVLAAKVERAISSLDDLSKDEISHLAKVLNKLVVADMKSQTSRYSIPLHTETTLRLGQSLFEDGVEPEKDLFPAKRLSYDRVPNITHYLRGLAKATSEKSDTNVEDPASPVNYRVVLVPRAAAIPMSIELLVNYTPADGAKKLKLSVQRLRARFPGVQSTVLLPGSSTDFIFENSHFLTIPHSGKIPALVTTKFRELQQQVKAYLQKSYLWRETVHFPAFVTFSLPPAWKGNQPIQWSSAFSDEPNQSTKLIPDPLTSPPDDGVAPPAPSEDGMSALLAASGTQQVSKPAPKKSKSSKLKPIEIDFLLQSVQTIESDVFALKTPHAVFEHLSLRGDGLAPDEEIYQLRHEPVAQTPKARRKEGAETGQLAIKTFLTLIEAGCEVVRGVSKI